MLQHWRRLGRVFAHALHRRLSDGTRLAPTVRELHDCAERRHGVLGIGGAGRDASEDGEAAARAVEARGEQPREQRVAEGDVRAPRASALAVRTNALLERMETRVDLRSLPAAAGAVGGRVGTPFAPRAVDEREPASAADSALDGVGVQT